MCSPRVPSSDQSPGTICSYSSAPCPGRAPPPRLAAPTHGRRLGPPIRQERGVLQPHQLQLSRLSPLCSRDAGSGRTTQLTPGLGHPEEWRCLSRKGGSGPSAIKDHRSRRCSTPSPRSHCNTLPFAGSLRGSEATHPCEAGGTVSRGGRTQAARCAPSEGQFCT